MTRDEIYANLTDVFHDVFDDDSITLRDDTTASDIADWDSQSHINLILAAEMRFGVRFRTSELDSLKNVGDFVSVIESKLARAG
jgi:acyl carrier protein